MDIMNIKLASCFLIGAFCSGPLLAQVDWSLGGNVVSLGTDYLGCNATSTFPLHLRTIPDLPINFSTSDLPRMTLNPTQTNSIGGTFTVPTDGFLGLGLNFQNSFFGTPWTRLHLLDEDYQPQVSDLFRDWMRNGVTMSSEYDQMYVGQMAWDDLDKNAPVHSIFQWGAFHDVEADPTLARFIYAGPYTGTASGENSRFGREVMQLTPTGFAGLGDWNAASVALGSTVSPSERLDVLDGRVRIRELPTSPSASNIDKIMVVDDNGVVHWRPISTWPVTGTGVADCKWTLIGAGNGNVVTAYAGNPGCSQADRKVGIGTSAPTYKLHVAQSEAQGSMDGGVLVDYRANSGSWRYGMRSILQPVDANALLSSAYSI